MFPDELPKRLIKMFSFIDNTILDPFAGTGTTLKVANELKRNSYGYEIGWDTDNIQNWRTIITKKVQSVEII